MAVHHSLLKNSFNVGVSTLLSRILGLLRVRLESVVLGGGDIASGWFLAFAIPNLLRRILGEGALSNALIPLVAEAESAGGQGRVRRELAVVFTVLSAILAAIVVLVSGTALLLQSTLHNSSFALFHSQRIVIMMDLLPILMPYAIFICLIGVIGAILNYARIFMLPALGALLLNIFMIGGLCWAWQRELTLAQLPEFLRILALLVLLSGAVQLAGMLILLKCSGLFPDLRKKSFIDKSILSRLWRLVLPGFIGGIALQMSFLADRFLAACLGPRAVPALTFVDRIIDLPIGIFAVSLSAVLMPQLARSAAEQRWEDMRSDLHFALRHTIFLCVPMGAGVVLLHEPMLRLLCFGGNFGAADLAATRDVAVFYGAGIPLFCILKVVVPAFNARKKMLLVLKVSLCTILLNIVLNLILMWPLRQGGIALATVLSSLTGMVIYFVLLRRDNLMPERRALVITLLKSLSGAGVASLAVWSCGVASCRLDQSWGRAFLLFMASGIFFVVIYFGWAWLIRSPEPGELMQIFRGRAKK